MSALTLCTSCKRHIRVTEPSCPFCGAQAAARELAPQRRPRGRQGGRAALFLAGAVGASACMERAVPVYGVPVDDDDQVEDDDAEEEATGDAAAPRKDAGEPPLATPVYGIPIDRRDAAVRDASATEPDAQAGRDAALGTPVYGIPIDPRDSGAPLCDGGSSEDLARRPAPEAGVDGGNACAPAVDAGRPLVAPVYGIPVDIDRPKP